MLSQGDAETIQ